MAPTLNSVPIPQLVVVVVVVYMVKMDKAVVGWLELLVAQAAAEAVMTGTEWVVQALRAKVRQEVKAV